jgi:hypothetical protein
MKNISELPDINGFRFIGISSAGVKFVCVVRIHPVKRTKRLVIDTADFACVSHLLIGWDDLPE